MKYIYWLYIAGNDRGPVLEVIVSRTNFISSHTERPVRVVGLSTALANARDLADWLGIKQMGLFNFRPSVRPVPLEVHIQGFPGKHYCPRMATMNRPAYHAIKLHSPTKPVLIFVSSRRQTRLTALDLIAYLAGDEDSKQWLHMPEAEMEKVITRIKESNLKLTLAFGIGLHHAGLHEHDRKTVEELFVNQKIQVLIATSTLAWGVNFPAHLVIVKGTEYYDGKTKHYVDFPITDVLQMMGRAGRPQFDNQGIAVILVHDVKKHFYKKFLYEPFPVESSLLEVLPDHLNAEIVAGTISTKQDAMDYITWTYFFRRLVMNPSFYKLDDTSTEKINRYLSQLVQGAVQDLVLSYCVQVAEDDYSLMATTLGRISSYYYLNHMTVRMFRDKLGPASTIPDLLLALAHAHEFAELPVRHNEDHINSELATKLPIAVDPHSYDNSNTKTHLLLQAHFSRIPLPSSDYHTDTKSVMDQAPRVLQAILDVSADAGWLATTLQVINLMQMLLQARWHYDNTLLTLPHLQPHHLSRLRRPQTDRNGSSQSVVIDCLPELIDCVNGSCERLQAMLGNELQKAQYDQIVHVLNQLPQIDVSLKLKGQLTDEAGQQCAEKPVSTSYRGGVRRDWVQVHVDTEYVLGVVLTRMNTVRKHDNRAYTPHFAKPKDEGWILVLGEVETRDVVALKRIGSMRGKCTSATLAFFAPERPGRVIYTLYVMSDCYLGLDQQYDLCLEAVRAPIGADTYCHEQEYGVNI
jgi:activating signal cointegrator complex subunit 3